MYFSQVILQDLLAEAQEITWDLLYLFICSEMRVAVWSAGWIEWVRPTCRCALIHLAVGKRCFLNNWLGFMLHWCQTRTQYPRQVIKEDELRVIKLRGWYRKARPPGSYEVSCYGLSDAGVCSRFWEAINKVKRGLHQLSGWILGLGFDPNKLLWLCMPTNSNLAQARACSINRSLNC